MVNCDFCKEKSVIINTNLCKNHFIEYVENTVKKTIEDFKLLNKKDKILVATSGGKDSLTTLYILKKLGYGVEGLLIDEGINNYREKTIIDMEEFSKKYNIPFIIKSFEKEYGYSLDESFKKLDLNACHACGIFRRQLLNKYSSEYDVIATGHNLDDEAQSVMMNVLKSQTELLSRIGPITGLKKSNKFTKKIKPLYFIPEKHIKIYTLLKGLKNTFTECPYTHDSFRNEVQEALNELESKKQGSKLNIVKHFLKSQDKIKEDFKTDNEINSCIRCGEPTNKEICNACELVEKLNK